MNVKAACNWPEWIGEATGQAALGSASHEWLADAAAPSRQANDEEKGFGTNESAC